MVGTQGDYLRLRDKISVITGGGSGIGRATAILFAQEGARVVVADLDEDAANETVRLIKKKGGEAIAVRTDVSRERDADEMVNATVKKFGRLDILFNNAGVLVLRSMIDTTEEEFDRVMSVNLKGVYVCSKYAARQMIKQRGGVIINASSDAGLRGFEDYTAYCASKGGVIGLTRAMAVELGKYNIRVNCTVPGNVETPMLEHEIRRWASVAGVEPENTRRLFAKLSLLNRIGTAETVAHGVLFLASEESSFTTGGCLLMEGGSLAGTSAVVA